LLERVAGFTIDLDASWTNRIANDLPLRLVHTRFDECFTPAIFQSWRVNFTSQKYELYNQLGNYDDVDFFFVTLCARNARIAGCIRHLTFTEGEDYNCRPSSQMLEWINKFSTVIRFCAEVCLNITSIKISLIHFINPIQFRAPPRLEKLHLRGNAIAAYLPWTLALSAGSKSSAILRRINLEPGEKIFPANSKQQTIALKSVLGRKKHAPHLLDGLAMSDASVVFVAALTSLLPLRPASLSITVNETNDLIYISGNDSAGSEDELEDPEWISAGLGLLGDSAFTTQLSEFALVEGRYCNIHSFERICGQFDKILANGWTKMISDTDIGDERVYDKVTWTKVRR
jgi:hypothetical protein